MQTPRNRIDPISTPTPTLPNQPSVNVYDEFMRAQANPASSYSGYRTGASYQKFSASALDETLRATRGRRMKKDT